MTKEELEKEAEERTKQYMNEHTEKYNCENTKIETDNYNAGLEQGYEEGFKDGAEFGYNKAKDEVGFRTESAHREGIAYGRDIAMEEIRALRQDCVKLTEENAVLRKALNLYVNWADECGVAWDNFPDMTEKWYKVVEEKGLGWIDGLVFMVTEEAKEQLMKEHE